MLVILKKKCILLARDIKSMFFLNCYYISFQDKQSFFLMILSPNK